MCRFLPFGCRNDFCPRTHSCGFSSWCACACMFQSRRFINAGGRRAVLLKGSSRLMRTLLFRLHDHAAAPGARGSGRGSGRLCVVSWKQEHPLPGPQSGSLNGRPPHTGVKYIMPRQWDKMWNECTDNWICRVKNCKYVTFEVAEDQIDEEECVF